jgi:hypothetical protein
MMIPSLPTDNLYKFCAITGLIIMGAAVYFPIVPFTDYRKKQIEWQGAFQDHIRLAEGLSAAYGEKEKEFAAVGKTRESPEWAAERDKFVKLFEKEMKAILDLFREGAKSAVDVDNLNLLRYAAIGGFIIGLGVAIYGFRNWRMIQLRQDELLFQEPSK